MDIMHVSVEHVCGCTYTHHMERPYFTFTGPVNVGKLRQRPCDICLVRNEYRARGEEHVVRALTEIIKANRKRTAEENRKRR
jgi:hypothetical protein